MKKLTDNKAKAVELYRPGKQPITRRGNYSIQPYEDEEVIEGQVELYKPQVQYVYKEAKKSFDLESSINKIWLWILFVAATSFVLMFVTARIEWLTSIMFKIFLLSLVAIVAWSSFFYSYIFGDRREGRK